MKSLLLALMLTATLAGCARTPETPDATAKSYPIRGEIVGFDRPRGVLLIHHEEIPGYMPAMTMEFSAAGVDLSTLREKQRISAVMGQPVDGVFPLTKFQAVESVADKAVSAAALALRQDTHSRGNGAYREEGETVPSFTLYNQDGQATSIDRFRGKHVVLNFIFTRCPVATMCPAATAKMMGLQRAAKEAGVKNFELISISFDEYDTPSVLREYAQVRGIDTGNFTFLTGPKSAIADLLVQFGVIVKPGENVFAHTLATVLIGPDGKIRHRSDNSSWSIDEFLKRLPATP